MNDVHFEALCIYLQAAGVTEDMLNTFHTPPRISRWAHLGLPNGQIA